MFSFPYLSLCQAKITSCQLWLHIDRTGERLVSIGCSTIYLKDVVLKHQTVPSGLYFSLLTFIMTLCGVTLCYNAWNKSRCHRTPNIIPYWILHRTLMCVHINLESPFMTPLSLKTRSDSLVNRQDKSLITNKTVCSLTKRYSIGLT